MTLRYLGEEVWILHSGGVHAHFVGAVIEQRRHIVSLAHAASYREWNGQDLTHAAHGFMLILAACVGGSHIEHHQLIGALLLISQRHGCRISGVTQPRKTHSLDHAPIGTIQTWDDSNSRHQATSNQRPRSAKP